ncbi:MAG: response regulator [Proteobacteria bacterium]|nr:response regulator [Pseudomonadota bacterium]
MLELQLDSPCVMVIDDVPETRMLLRDMLEEMGFLSVIEASNGRDALEKLKSTPTHLILCDHMMDEMSGLDLLSQLRNHPYLVDIPFMVVSAVGDVPVIETALDLGADDYLMKPVSFQLLRRKVSDVFRRRCA